MTSFKVRTPSGLKGPYSKRVILRGLESGKIPSDTTLVGTDTGEEIQAGSLLGPISDESSLADSGSEGLSLVEPEALSLADSDATGASMVSAVRSPLPHRRSLPLAPSSGRRRPIGSTQTPRRTAPPTQPSRLKWVLVGAGILLVGGAVAGALLPGNGKSINPLVTIPREIRQEVKEIGMESDPSYQVMLELEDATDLHISDVKSRLKGRRFLLEGKVSDVVEERAKAEVHNRWVDEKPTWDYREEFKDHQKELEIWQKRKPTTIWVYVNATWESIRAGKMRRVSFKVEVSPERGRMLKKGQAFEEQVVITSAERDGWKLYFELRPAG